MNIFCVVRNYAPHAAEMKSPLPAEPTFFEKPHTALLSSPATLTDPADFTATWSSVSGFKIAFTSYYWRFI